MKPSVSALLAALLLLPLHAQDEEKEKDKNKIPLTSLDASLFDEALWTKSLEDLQTSTKPAPEIIKTEKGTLKRQYPGMEWLSTAKDGLRANPTSYQLLGKKVGEVIVRGREGKPGEATVSVFNRGDDGEIPPATYEAKLKEWKTMLDEKLAVRSEERKQQGSVPLEGWIWKKGDTAVLLEGSLNRSEKRPEFIRLRLTSVSASKNAPTKMARRDSFAANVKKDDKGFTYIDGIPMVDQGQKGYCVVASVERVARYFGANIDQHEMAQLANTSDSGTTGTGMDKAFQRITGKIHLRTLKHIDYDEKRAERDIRAYNTAAKKGGFKTLGENSDIFGVDPREIWFTADKDTYREVKRGQPGYEHFERKIKEYVDQGIPLCWTLFLGMFPEKGLPQSYGGHMRLITGYNFTSKDPAEHQIYYTDSWGSGHERKAMRADEGFCMTMALYSMVPNK